MGQYFTPVFLNSAGAIVHALNPADYGSAEKLGGHSRADMALMHAVQIVLSLDGALRLVWAGDYAEPEPGQDANLYFRVEDRHFLRIAELLHPDCALPPNMQSPDPERRNVYGCFCNEDKRAFVDHLTLPVDNGGARRTPLPILTAEGGWAEAASAGDVGTWARDRICYRTHRPGKGWSDVTPA